MKDNAKEKFMILYMQRALIENMALGKALKAAEKAWEVAREACS